LVIGCISHYVHGTSVLLRARLPATVAQQIGTLPDTTLT